MMMESPVGTTYELRSQSLRPVGPRMTDKADSCGELSTAVITGKASCFCGLGWGDGLTELLTILHVFAVQFSGVGYSNERFSGVRRPNFAKLGRDTAKSFLRKNLVSELDIMLHLQTRAAQSWVMFKTTPNFALFDPPPCENYGRGGGGEISIPIVEALPMTEHSKYIWRPSTVRLLSAVDWWKKKKKQRVHG